MIILYYFVKITYSGEQPKLNGFLYSEIWVLLNQSRTFNTKSFIDTVEILVRFIVSLVTTKAGDITTLPSYPSSE